MWIGPSYGELDFYPLIAILSTSCLIAVPLLNWSSSLRNLGCLNDSRQGARIIIIWWAFWVALACGACLVGFWFDPSFIIYNESAASTIICIPPTNTVDYAVGQSPNGSAADTRFYVDTEWIKANRCMDPCTQGPFKWPAAIFRSHSDLQSLSHEETQYLIQDLYGKSFFTFYVVIGTAMGFVVLFQGLWAMCFGRRSPRQCRQLIYKFFRDVKMPNFKAQQWQGTITVYGQEWQRTLAKYLAISAYLWAVIASVICVMLFFFNIIALELLLSGFPQSESARHVGAWSAWAATGLIVAAAFISKIPHNPIRKVFRSTSQAMKRFNCLISSTARRTMSRKNGSKQDQSALTEQTTLGDAAEAKPGRASELFNQVRTTLVSCRRTVIDEWRSLKGFWKDPDCTETAIG